MNKIWTVAGPTGDVDKRIRDRVLTRLSWLLRSVFQVVDFKCSGPGANVLKRLAHANLETGGHVSAAVAGWVGTIRACVTRGHLCSVLHLL